MGLLLLSSTGSGAWSLSTSLWNDDQRFWGLLLHFTGEEAGAGAGGVTCMMSPARCPQQVQEAAGSGVCPLGHCVLSEPPSVGMHHYVQMSEVHFQGKRMSLAPLTSSRAILTGISVVCLSGCLPQHCSDRAPCSRPWQTPKSPAGRPPGLLGRPTAAAHAVLPASHSRSSCLPLCTQNPGGLFPPFTEAQRGGVAGPVPHSKAAV